MIGPLTLGRKAAKAGYKRYGYKGAIAGGLAGAGGYVVAKRTVKKAVTSADESATDETTTTEADYGDTDVETRSSDDAGNA